MNSLVLNRLIWKDVRELYGLYIAGFVTFLIVIALTLFSWGEFDNSIIENLMLPLRMFTSLCGILLGVLLFAPERENGTSQLLANLPVRRSKLALTKIVLALVSLILFMCLAYATVWLIGKSYSAYHPNWPPTPEVVGDLFVPFLCLAFGILWSTQSKSSLFALIAAACSMLVAEGLVHNVFTDMDSWWKYAGVHMEAVGGLRAGLLLLSLVALALALPGWLQDEQLTVRGFVDSSTQRFWSKSVESTLKSSLQPRSAMSSLVWQTARESRWWVLGGLLLCALIAGVNNYLIPPQGLRVSLFAFAFVISFAYACTAFLNDNYKEKFRFFQQQSEHGRKLWVARLSPSVLMVLAATLCLILHSHSIGSDYGYVDYLTYNVAPNLTPLNIFLVLFSGMAVGQFFSMLFSSPILSVVAAMAYGFLMFVWAMFLISCYASLIWFLLPIAIACLFGTWYHAPNWLAEKKSKLSWSLPCLVVAGVLVSFATFRANEVSPVSGIDRATYLEAFEMASGGNADNFATSIYKPEMETAVLYRKALRSYAGRHQLLQKLFQPFSGEYSWLQVGERVEALSKQELNDFIEGNKESLELIHQATRGNKPYAFLDPTSYHHSLHEMHKINITLVAEYRYWRDGGGLDKALKSLFALFRFEQSAQVYGRTPHSLQLFYQWSELPNQDADTIKQAIKRLDHEMQELHLHAANMRKEYARLSAQGQLNGIVSGDMDLLTSSGVPIVNKIVRWMPWEIQRSQRAADWIIECDYQTEAKMLSEIIKHPRRCLDNPGDIREIMIPNWWGSDWQDLPLYFRTTWGLDPYISSGSASVPATLKEIQLFRYAKIRMALNARRLERNTYPEKLGELVPEYIAAIPCDVFSGGEFYYSPQGMAHPVLHSLKFSRGVSIHMVGIGQTGSYDKKLVIQRYTQQNLIPSLTPFVLPWSSSGGQTVEKIRVEDEESRVEDEFIECFEVSATDDFIDQFMRKYWADVALPKIINKTAEK